MGAQVVGSSRLWPEPRQLAAATGGRLPRSYLWRRAMSCRRITVTRRSQLYLGHGRGLAQGGMWFNVWGCSLRVIDISSMVSAMRLLTSCVQMDQFNSVYAALTKVLGEELIKG